MPTHLRSHSLQLEQLSESSLKEFFIKVVDMMDSGSVTARSRAMVALCNFLSKGKGRDKINIDGLSTLLPKLLRFLPADRSNVFTDAELFLAGFAFFACRNKGSSLLTKMQGPLQELFAISATASASASSAATWVFWGA
jgi:hypothetical protein